jgi:diguanylate cyclase
MVHWQRDRTTTHDTVQIQNFGSTAWQALQKHGVLPTPQNYEVLYAYYANARPELTQRLTACLANGVALSSNLLAELHQEYFVDKGDADTVSQGSDAIVKAAQALIEQISGNLRGLRSYDEALAHWAGRLDAQLTADGLLQAITALATETAQASERNRALELELSTSSDHIAKLRQNLVAVQQEATTDGLTGIANRKAFDTRLRQAVKQAEADSSSVFSLLLLDIDHFKRFNDTHGHRTGDHVLRLVGRLLSDNIKGRDTAARYGGEEFAILLDGADLMAGLTVATQFCEKLAGRRLIKRDTGETIGQVTCSIGVAQFQATESGAALVERADQALYEAKHRGRNQARAAE